MNRFLILLFVSLAFTNTAASAATFVVKAGEHGAFSRVKIEQAANSRITLKDRSIRVMLPAPVDAVDLKAVNTYRRAHRITSARVINAQEAPEIIFEIGCDCKAKTYISEDNALVIDISDRAPSDSDVALTAGNTDTPLEKAAIPAENSTMLDTQRKEARLVGILRSAGSEGVVEWKDDEVASIEMAQNHEEQSQQPSPPAENPAPRAAAAPPTPIECQNHALILQSETNQADAFDLIEKLKVVTSDASPENKAGFDKTLATAYLSIGFFDEAWAITKKYQDQGVMRYIQAVAALMNNAGYDFVHYYAEQASCDSLSELFYMTALLQGPSPVPLALQQRHLESLTSLPKTMLIPVSKTLIENALAQRQFEWAQVLIAIVEKANPNGEDIVMLRQQLSNALTEDDKPAMSTPPKLSASLDSAKTGQPMATHKAAEEAPSPGAPLAAPDAWRIGNWQGVIDGVQKKPPLKKDASFAEYILLAAYMLGVDANSEILAPELLTHEHLKIISGFSASPPDTAFNNPTIMSAFSVKVKNEIDYMKSPINYD